jgi:phytoene desaturase
MVKSKRPTAIVIGAGFASLSAACYLAKAGYRVTILEKNSQPGGRARSFSEKGFTFDMGPSWYWMPDVFDSFFADFGKKTSDYYTLERLSPSYQVYFGQEDCVQIPSNLDEFFALFESIESGSSEKLKQFLAEAAFKYEVGMQDLVHKPGQSLTEFIDKRVIQGVFRFHLFESFHSYIRKYFTHPKILQLLEFPVLFLGAQPKNIPALYSLMNYADIKLGTWYPKGGMIQIVNAMVSLATELGVEIKLNEAVTKIDCVGQLITSIETTQNTYTADIVVGGADYHHIEQNLLPKAYQQYSEKYWDNRVLAPSSLLYYVGLNKKLDKLLHHNLFFDADFNQHGHEIYEQPAWPTDPLFYVSVTSKTDPSVAPDGCENLFILIPTAPGLMDNEEVKERYFNMVIQRLESHLGTSIGQHIVYRRDFACSDFMHDYNSFKGNAYGLANTLMQTAVFKPKMKSKKLRNLYYTGQLTTPGPGVPPSLISGKVVSELIQKQFNPHGYKTIVR